MNMFKKAVAAAAAAGATVPAFAVDITEVQAELVEGLTNVTTIGGVVLTICVAIAVFKYVRKAM